MEGVDDEGNGVPAPAACEALRRPSLSARLRAHLAAGTEPGLLDDLAVAQDLRDSGVLSRAAAFHLVAWRIDRIVAEDLAEEPWPEPFRSLTERMQEIERDYGLTDDEFWPPGAGPGEHQRLSAMWDDAHDSLIARRMHDHGEALMAEMFLSDRRSYERIYEEGRQQVHRRG
jgi:hypothetical protein